NQLNLLPTDTVATLVGKTFPQSVEGDPQPPGRISFTGHDFVNIVPDQSPPGKNPPDTSVVPLPSEPTSVPSVEIVAPPTEAATDVPTVPTDEATPTPVATAETTDAIPPSDSTNTDAATTDPAASPPAG